LSRLAQTELRIKRFPAYCPFALRGGAEQGLAARRPRQRRLPYAFPPDNAGHSTHVGTQPAPCSHGGARPPQMKRRTGIAGFPAGSPPTRLDAASAASELIKMAHAQSPAPRRGMGNRPAPAPQIARRGHRAPGTRSRLKAGAPSPCRRGVEPACWAYLSWRPLVAVHQQLALIRPRTLPAHPQSYEPLIRSLLSPASKGRGLRAKADLLGPWPFALAPTSGRRKTTLRALVGLRLCLARRQVRGRSGRAPRAEGRTCAAAGRHGRAGMMRGFGAGRRRRLREAQRRGTTE
jgi:hypothetical protein